MQIGDSPTIEMPDERLVLYRFPAHRTSQYFAFFNSHFAFCIHIRPGPMSYEMNENALVRDAPSLRLGSTLPAGPEGG
jgi:hypothetical protein